jgi:hypothetical protein
MQSKYRMRDLALVGLVLCRHLGIKPIPESTARQYRAHPRARTQRVIDYIEANPNLSQMEYAVHFGITRQNISMLIASHKVNWQSPNRRKRHEPEKFMAGKEKKITVHPPRVALRKVDYSALLQFFAAHPKAKLREAAVRFGLSNGRVWQIKKKYYVPPTTRAEKPKLNEKNSNKLNLEGRKFARLTAIKYAGHSQWECKCDCGNLVRVRTCKLNAGKQVSCGCARKDSAIRTLAREKVSAERRREISNMGVVARYGQKIAVEKA